MVLGRLCDMKTVITIEIGTWEEPTESLTVNMPVTTTVERLHPLGGAGHTRPGGMMTCARMVTSGEPQSTQESLG